MVVQLGWLGVLLEVSQVSLIGKNPVEQICERVLEDQRLQGQRGPERPLPCPSCHLRGQTERALESQVICLGHRQGGQTIEPEGIYISI